MFKMDASLTDTMEEFQELVKANGEELHCRLIDTTQMWVSRFWQIFQNHLLMKYNPGCSARLWLPAVTTALSPPGEAPHTSRVKLPHQSEKLDI